MYAKLHADPTKNLFFSPFSISEAFAMAYAGAVGQTATDIAKAMHFTLPQDRLHPAFDWLDLQLASRAMTVTGNNGKPFTMHVANSLWSQEGYPVLSPFLDTLAVDYGAGVHTADFVNHADQALVAINGWTSQQTNGKIPNLLPVGSIDYLTRLVLVDAIYFDANWASEFPTPLTAPAPFARADGSTEQVPTMSQTATLPYASASGWQAVELAYDGYDVAMDVVLPSAGGDAQFDAALDAATFASIVGAMQPTYVELALPKFRVAPAGSTDIIAMLKALGMNAPFDAGTADFSAISPKVPYIKHVYHQAFVDVDEHGTEAAAATGIVFGVDAGIGLPPPQPVVMTVDRPFFVAIRDLRTATILFAGKIADPALMQ
jgi:serpin B